MLVLHMTQGYRGAPKEQKSFITSTFTLQFVFPLLAFQCLDPTQLKTECDLRVICMRILSRGPSKLGIN